MRGMQVVALGMMLGCFGVAGADQQRIAPGTGTQDAIVADTGANGLCETAAAKGDLQAAKVGQGTPNLAEVRCGADRVAQSAAAGDDVQVIAVGGDCRNANAAVVDTGPNGIADTPLAGDDAYVGGMTLGSAPANTACVITGADGVAQTAAPAGDDVQLLLAGQAEPNTDVVRCGPNGVADTTANNVEAGDDVQRVPVGDPCAANAVVVDSGADGIATTRAEGPDLRIKIAKPVSLSIRKGRASATKVLKFTVANVEFGPNAPAVRAFRLGATRGSCPGGAVTQLDADAKAAGLQATATVALGKKAKAALTVEVGLEDVTTAAKANPYRCSFDVSAVAIDTDPDVDDAANEENNSTTVPVEVVDQNDL